ncbi:MAG: WG repeat-containing protein [Clostridia bacterium]|nr:WG repeat-containing protein [Clostridia bacterium]
MNTRKKCLCLALLVLMALCLSGCALIGTGKSYREAQKLMVDGSYAEAADAFAALGGYEEASRLSVYCRAHVLAGEGNYALAAASMAALGDFRDAPMQAQYYLAQDTLNAAPESPDNYDVAEALFASLGVFRESHTVSVSAAAHEDGLRLLEEGRFSASADIFAYLKGRAYKDSGKLRGYALARDDEAAGNLIDAAEGYADLGDFRDSAQRRTACVEAAYQALQASMDADTLLVARAQLSRIQDSSLFSGYDDLAQLGVYLDARKLEEKGGADIANYTRAAAMYAKLGDFRDSAQRAQSIPESIYTNAVTALEQGDYAAAATLFGHQPDYRDSLAMVSYTEACRLYSEAEGKRAAFDKKLWDDTAEWEDLERFWEASLLARDAFTALGDFRDAADRAHAAQYLVHDYAVSLADQQEYGYAGTILTIAEDQPEWAQLSEYYYGMDDMQGAMKAGHAYRLVLARNIFLELGEYRDAAAKAQECVDELRAMGDAALAAGDFDGAADAYMYLPDEAEVAALHQYLDARRDEASAAGDVTFYVAAAGAYEALGDFRDSAERAASCREALFALAEAAFAEARYEDAATLYSYQPEYKNGMTLTTYSYAMMLETEAKENPAEYAAAADHYELLGDFSDAADRAAACREALFALAEAALAEARYEDAAKLYGYQGEYKDGGKLAAYALAMKQEAAAKEDPVQYAAAADRYETLGDFRDSADRAAACRETLFALAEAALAEARYEDAAAYYSSQPGYNTADKQVEYVSALALQAKSEANAALYLDAAAAFDAMDGFRDSAERADACRSAYYDAAAAMVDAGEYAAASTRLALLGDYGDAPKLIEYCNARQMLNSTALSQALPVLTALGDFRDAPALLADAKADLYEKGKEIFEDGDYAAAAATLRLVDGYEDASAFASYAEGLVAEAAWLAGDAAGLDTAKAAYAAAADFRDAPAHLASITACAEGLSKLEAGDFDAAETAFARMGGYPEAEELAAHLRALPVPGQADAGTLAAYGSAMANEARGIAGDVNGYILAADQYEAMGPVLDAPERTVRLRNKLNILFADEVREASEGLRAVKRNGKWGFANANDELISDFQWDSCLDFCEGYAGVKKDGKWGFIRKDGSVHSEPKYETVHDFSDERALVKTGKHYNYLTTTGEHLLKGEYSQATDFSQERAMVYEDYWNTDGWTLIDLNGVKILNETVKVDGDSRYIKKPGSFKNGFARIGISDYSYGSSADDYIYINLNGKYISDTEPTAVGNYWKIKHNKKDAYMNQKGVIVTYASSLSFNEEGYCLTTVDGKKGMIHRDGRTITGNQWDEIHHFSGERALVRNGNYYGYISRDGKQVISCKYNAANDFHDGLALVKLNGMCGFINEAGEEVVPLIYDDATDFADGKATVQRYGQWTTIGTDGKPVK